jgi:hypothetical protein
MEGKGFYNNHSKPQHSAIQFGLPLMTRAVESVLLPVAGEVFVLADYGVAGGYNSMEPVGTSRRDLCHVDEVGQRVLIVRVGVSFCLTSSVLLPPAGEEG